MPLDLSIAITSNAVSTTGKISAEQWTHKRAFHLGLRWCLIAWCGALITLPIPILHFVAVPACLMIGPPLGFVIYRFYRGSTDIISGDGTCPACRGEWNVSNQTVDWPYNTSCAHCRADLAITVSS